MPTKIWRKMSIFFFWFFFFFRPTPQIDRARKLNFATLFRVAKNTWFPSQKFICFFARVIFFFLQCAKQENMIMEDRTKLYYWNLACIFLTIVPVSWMYLLKSTNIPTPPTSREPEINQKKITLKFRDRDDSTPQIHARKLNLASHKFRGVESWLSQKSR